MAKIKKIIIGNWKMNPVGGAEALKLAKMADKSGAIVAPPAVYLGAVKKVLKKAGLAAQDVFSEDPLAGGAYTGEISAKMLKNLGVKYVIVGHSERRAMGETSEMINKKIKVCLKEKIVPVLCVGEQDRNGTMEYFHVIKEELQMALDGVAKNSLKNLVIAYEPVWAIGRKALREATPEEFLEIKIFIKKVLSDIFGVKDASAVKIIYGGSVDEKNAADFLARGEADGLLIGRASLNANKFLKICNQ